MQCSTNVAFAEAARDVVRLIVPEEPESLSFLYKPEMKRCRAMRHGKIIKVFFEGLVKPKPSHFKPHIFVSIFQRIDDNVDIPYLTIRKQCDECLKYKFLIEFFRNPKNQTYSDTCKTCKVKLRNSASSCDYWLRHDRTSKGGFLKYMQRNPYYFQYVFGCEATPKNIKKQYHYLMEINS